ncbi:ribosome small subunit-dependent GTPase A [Azoarcus indigens]|uniref:Small ribosomal subunit biogenesis GTPase RsgA n=1 Tax=Azoarcus indigens TaxID=29545 RepID=A0A4R6EFW7_9RHOO|nr:ribosome small subunit-dependent GTPase A [Azoarcus indigens]NMG63695.1 ribosome small subunit-dependent GTPase A [Azoarcus indigens]TDN56228.1 ribosome biogenesis GTPase [Azoarcus indigens]
MRGRVTAAFGRHYEIDTGKGLLQGYPRGKKSVFACGDEVEILPQGEGQGAIVELHPRRSLLWRSDAFREKLIAANLSHIAIVVATEPGFSDLLLSRCIAAAESQGITPLIILNKSDLSAGLPLARERLAPFVALGYQLIELSALEGAEKLRPWLENRHSILVGQSGMGKSTLTNALIPGAKAATREISTALDTGKHTTTFARLYPLGEDGWMIDSPGLQAFGLAHLGEEELAEAFVEFRPFLGQCRFRDCRHEAEPGCAILASVASGEINVRRFEHYRSIKAEIAEARRLNPGW